MSGSGIKSIAFNAIYLSSARLIASVARALYAIALAKWLGAELYGLINYGLSWYLLFVQKQSVYWDLMSFWCPTIGRDRAKAGAASVGETLALRTASSFAIALLSFLLAVLIEPDPLSRLLLFIFSLALFGRGLTMWAYAVFRAHEASGFVLVQEVVFRLLEVLVGVALLLMGFGVVAIAMVHAGVWLLQGAVGLGLVRRYLLDVRMVWDASALLWLIKRGAPFVVGGFLMGWLLQGPIVMYRHLQGISQDLGQLALALQALVIVGSVASEAGGAALPVLARSVDRGDGKSDHYVDLVLRGGMLISGMLAISAFAIGPWLVELLFGASYSFTAALLPWTLILVAPFFWIHALSIMIVAHGRYRMVMISNAMGAAVFTVAFPLLAPIYDLYGVVLALALGLGATVLGQLATLRHHHALPFFVIIVRSATAVAGGLLITYLALSLNQWVAMFLGWTALVGFALLIRVFSASMESE